MISAIVAVDSNWGIGYQGKLLETIPEDLKRFKQLTTGNGVVMGRKTWDSLPIKPLPNRFNIIISRHSVQYQQEDSCWWTSLEECLMTMLNDDINDYYIIGGEIIYKTLLNLCDRVYVTKIYKNHENVDAYFPNLDHLVGEWKVTSISDMYKQEDFTYQFLTYDRIY